MKCVCGYEHEAGIDEHGVYHDSLKGDSRFIKVQDIAVDLDRQVKIKTIFMCPKCFTLRVGENWY